MPKPLRVALPSAPSGIRFLANREWYRSWAVPRLVIETMEVLKLICSNPHLDTRAFKEPLPAAA
jgi:hypothetical protein